MINERTQSHNYSHVSSRKHCNWIIVHEIQQFRLLSGYCCALAHVGINRTWVYQMRKSLSSLNRKNCLFSFLVSFQPNGSTSIGQTKKKSWYHRAHTKKLSKMFEFQFWMLILVWKTINLKFFMSSMCVRFQYELAWQLWAACCLLFFCLLPILFLHHDSISSSYNNNWASLLSVRFNRAHHTKVTQFYRINCFFFYSRQWI